MAHEHGFFHGIVLHAGSLFDPKPHKIEEQQPEWPPNVEDVPIPTFDSGVFVTELVNLAKLPEPLTNVTSHEQATVQANPEVLLSKAQATAPRPIGEGTYRGTQLALTKIYSMIEQSYSSFMDVSNFEPLIPRPLTIEEKRELFQFTDPKSDDYPPHLNLGKDNYLAKAIDKETKPGELQKPDLDRGKIFSQMRLAQLSSLLPPIVPMTFLDKIKLKVGQEVAELEFGDMGTPDQGHRLADVEAYNKKMRAKKGILGSDFLARKDVFDLPNVGDISDWWSDRRFGQQQFTGTNPATLEMATDERIQNFIDAATSETTDQKMKKKIESLRSTDRESLYMQDYSYFRKAAGVYPEDAVIKCLFEEDGESKHRYGTASICLFHLQSDGMLQPLAIVLDWRGSNAKSITIYNKELSLSEQKVDWPWRYAKTCVQVSDWLRHEVTVHLTNTHLIEEATIVAAQRAFLDTHPVFQLLYPHWQKTLALNAGARATLVPHVIIELVGLDQAQARTFIQSEFTKFDFQGNYVPADLKRRGFDPKKRNDPKYVNYAYARCIYSMWWKIRLYVEEMLSISYKKGGQDADQAVKDDKYIKDWYTILQAPPGPKEHQGAGISTFPTITTFEQLVDAVTMCIHLASPQHTAVNYLQNYYQSFVVNKPPCLYAEMPETRKILEGYKEADLVKALPMNHTREWLLASHIPYLLSFKPGDKESLIIYAASKYHVYKKKTEPDEIKIKEAAARFYASLAESEKEFKQYGRDVWDSNEIQYDVLSPSWNAVSILI